MSDRARRVLVVCQLDGFANSLKPVATARFLRRRGHDVTLLDTYSLSRASSRRESRRHALPAPEPLRMALYAVEAGAAVARRHPATRRRLSYVFLMADHRLRRRILRSAVDLASFDLVICETPYDSGLLMERGARRTLYGCPTPWADELLLEGRLTPDQHARFRRFERALWERVDHLTFHWESYARYARAHYGITGRNLMTLNFGCTPATVRARFADPPRIAYVGSLGSRFIDMPLLARLARRYPHIDVYGAPEPDPRLGLNYRGYADPAVLRDYQLGLVTCTKDELRRDGFSAKHLEYLAHGLPVLVPSWRRHLDLLEGSVPYDEETFVRVVHGLAVPDAWQRMSDVAYRQAERLSWERTLRPLEGVLG